MSPPQTDFGLISPIIFMYSGHQGIREVYYDKKYNSKYIGKNNCYFSLSLPMKKAYSEVIKERGNKATPV